MANQEAFTLMVQHLRTQGAPSMRGSNCLYYHKDGIRRCAVGVLIPEGQYKYNFEGQPVGIIYNNVPALQGIDLALLTTMQEAHDTFRRQEGLPFSAFMEIQFRYIANTFELEVPTHPCTETNVAEVESANLSREEVRL